MAEWFLALLEDFAEHRIGLEEFSRRLNADEGLSESDNPSYWALVLAGHEVSDGTRSPEYLEGIVVGIRSVFSPCPIEIRVGGLVGTASTTAVAVSVKYDFKEVSND